MFLPNIAAESLFLHLIPSLKGVRSNRRLCQDELTTLLMIIETGSVMIAMPYGAMRTFVKYTRPIMIGKAQSATSREEKEKAEIIFDKFKNGKKLSTEELLLLQKYDIN